MACRNATETVACTVTCIIIMWRQTDLLYVKLRLVFDIVYIFILTMDDYTFVKGVAKESSPDRAAALSWFYRAF